MNADLMLDLLVRAGARVGRTTAGAIVLADAPAELIGPALELGPDLALAIAGRGSGHRWAACELCHRPALIATGKQQPCRQTPRCPGKLKALARTPVDEGLGLPCARPGCERAAVTITATLEALCLADFHHLALAKGRS